MPLSEPALSATTWPGTTATAGMVDMRRDGPAMLTVPPTGSIVLPRLRTSSASERPLPRPNTRTEPSLRFGRGRAGFRRRRPMTRYCGMIPLRAFFLRCLANTSMPPYSDPPGGLRRIRMRTVRVPGRSLNDRGEAMAYADSDVPPLMLTWPDTRSWRQGRTATVTFSVPFVVFLIFTRPTVPRFARCSTVGGVSAMPPAAARARGAESSARAITPPVATPATATIAAPARGRLLGNFTFASPRFVVLPASYGVSEDTVTRTTLW